MLSFISVTVFWLSLLVKEISGSNTTCYQTSECEGDTLSSDIVTCSGSKSCEYGDISATDTARCRGYLACRDASVTGSSNSILSCLGLNGCNGATLYGGSSSKIHCNGRSGCNSASITGETDSQVLCYSYLSCANSYIKMATSDDGQSIYCSGFRSCRYANISGAAELYISGEQAARDAIIFDISYISVTGKNGMKDGIISSSGVTDLSVYGEGYYSLRDLTLDCISGSECTVYCIEKTSCSGLTFNCYSGATCDIDCDDDWQTCPDITTYSTIEKPDKSDKSLNKLLLVNNKKHNNDDSKDSEDNKPDIIIPISNKKKNNKSVGNIIDIPNNINGYLIIFMVLIGNILIYEGIKMFYHKIIKLNFCNENNQLKYQQIV